MSFGELVSTSDFYQESQLPTLIKTEVTGSIVHTFATVTFKQQFKTINRNYYSLYINPPEGCVIYNVKCKYNDKLTEFVVHKLEEPITYGNYYFDSNSDAINLTLGLIPKNTKVKISISCTFTAILSSPNSFSFIFPIKKEYHRSLFSFDLTLQKTNEKYNKIELSQGSLKLKNKRIVLPSIKITKDFQITFKFSKEIKSQAFSTQIDRFNYIGLSLVLNPIKSDFSLKQEIYLLIDCSASMEGTKIKYARSALINFLENLPKDCYFNVLRFGTNFEQMFESSVENNKENVEKSLEYANSLDADLVSTNIYSPLMSIINEKQRKGFVRQVFAITDGIVLAPANVIAICTSNRHIMRVYPIGIGADVDRGFIKELAKATNGEEHFVDDDSIHTITNVVLESLKSSQVSAVVNTEIHVEGVDSFEVAPHPVPSLFENKLEHAIIRYERQNDDSDKNILINGECGDLNYENIINITEVKPIIDFHKLFAYQNIRDLEDKMINTIGKDDAEMIRENIVRLSMQCEVVSSFTGFFTVINGIEQKQDDPYRDDFNFNFSQCQQEMTPKQFRNQDAFNQKRLPFQQEKRGWSGSQMQQSSTASKTINQQISSQQSKIEKVLFEKVPIEKIDVQEDKFLIDLLKIQNENGSWNDSSLLKKLVNLKNKNPTIDDLFLEYPNVGDEIKHLNIECIITLLVIGWLYSNRKSSSDLFRNHAKKSVAFLKSNTDIKIHKRPSNNTCFTKGVSWKS